MVIIILDFLNNTNYILLAFLSTLFTYLLTMFGAASVFFFKKVNQKIMSFMFGFGAGVMIAASFFSLILPALNQVEHNNQKNGWMIIVFGFLFGGLFILLIDLLMPHLHLNSNKSEGIKTKCSKKILLVLAITLHNIPEGMAVGVAFASAFLGIPGSTYISAFMVALGIGLQNIPEGMAISLPLRTEGMSRKKAFVYGQASGIVEPISGVIGAILVAFVSNSLPFILCFASGAMIYVVVEELIPSGKTNEKDKLGTLGVIIGFVIMMAFDIVFS